MVSTEKILDFLLDPNKLKKRLVPQFLSILTEGKDREEKGHWITSYPTNNHMWWQWCVCYKETHRSFLIYNYWIFFKHSIFAFDMVVATFCWWLGTEVDNNNNNNNKLAYNHIMIRMTRTTTHCPVVSICCLFGLQGLN